MDFPYAMRPGQERLVAAIREAVASGGHLIAESGTGTGKTISAVYATLAEAEARDLGVLYLTRTNAQQTQVVTELRRLGVYGLGLQGRAHLCALLPGEAEFAHASFDELARACRERKSRELRGESGCSFYGGLLAADLEKERRWCEETVPTPEEFTRVMAHRGVCPYELNKLQIADAALVAAPYVYFFVPAVRGALLRWMNRPLEDVVVVIDEAHNLPEYARQLGTVRLTRHSLDLCLREIEELGDPEILEGVTVRDLCDLLRRTIEGFVREYSVEDDALLPLFALEEAILSAYTITTTKLRLLTENLLLHGEAIRESRSRQGKLPRSHLFHLGGFLQGWLQAEGEAYGKLVLGGANPGLEAYALDASAATRALRVCHATVHMSGTLRPLDLYRDEIGLPPTAVLLEVPSGFPPENRRAVYLEDVTTRYDTLGADPRIYPRLRDHVVAACNATDRNTVVFYPSHAFLASFLDIRPRIRRPVYVESQDLGQGELMSTVARFRADRGVLFAVAGGRVSEGMDFPDRELEVAVFVGLPYPKPSARLRALELFGDSRFGEGWRYAVEAPTQRKVLQCLGRLIRSERDRGVAVILDARAKRFRHVIRGLERSGDAAATVAEFFEGSVAPQAEGVRPVVASSPR